MSLYHKLLFLGVLTLFMVSICLPEGVRQGKVLYFLLCLFSGPWGRLQYPHVHSWVC